MIESKLKFLTEEKYWAVGMNIMVYYVLFTLIMMVSCVILIQI